MTTWLWFSIQNVRRNGRRAFITLLIAAVGTAGLLAAGGFARYTYDGLKEAAARDSGHLVLAHRDFFDGDEEVPLQHGLADPSGLQRELLRDPRVKAALPRLQLSGLLSNGEKSAVFVGTGVDAEGELRVRGPFLTFTEGEALSAEPAGGDALPEILVGVELARALRAHPGSVLTLMATTVDGALNAQDVRVKGVYTVGVPDLDRRAITVHLATAQKLLLTDKASTLSVYLRAMDDVGGMGATLASEHPELARRTWLDEAFYYRSVKALYDRIFGLLGVVIVVLVLFAISNTIGMAVVERTREIGTLRALGAVPGLVTRNFVLEGLLVGVGGALLGAALAWLIALGVDVFQVQMPPPPGRSDGYPLHLELGAGLYLKSGLAVALAAAVAAWAASRRAAARPIVEALTHV